jgi:hypothetical protein
VFCDLLGRATNLSCLYGGNLIANGTGAFLMNSANGYDAACAAGAALIRVDNLRYADGCPGTPTGFYNNALRPFVFASAACSTDGAQRFDLTPPDGSSLPEGAQLWLNRFLVTFLPGVDLSQPITIFLTQAGFVCRHGP